MLIIQHRANDPDMEAQCDTAEIDVQIMWNGSVVVGHNLWDKTHNAEQFLRNSKFKNF